jgi:hypothetical protein
MVLKTPIERHVFHEDDKLLSRTYSKLIDDYDVRQTWTLQPYRTARGRQDPQRYSLPVASIVVAQVGSSNSGDSRVKPASEEDLVEIPQPSRRAAFFEVVPCQRGHPLSIHRRLIGASYNGCNTVFPELRECGERVEAAFAGKGTGKHHVGFGRANTAPLAGGHLRAAL